MSKLISCCGLDCAACEARMATAANDDKLRKEVAEKWKAQHNPDITSEMINCTGCCEEGVKFGYCSACQIRSCAKQKGYATCGDCTVLESCATIGELLKHVPAALDNLKSLK